jgi:hypothetical protein
MMSAVLAGEVAWTADRTERDRFWSSAFGSILWTSSTGVVTSSIMSSKAPLMNPESVSKEIGGRLGLDLDGKRYSTTGGDDGMLNEVSKRPW